MSAAETVAGLASFEQRGAGSNSERRAALWLAQQLEEAGRAVTIEPFWSRPNTALAHAWHVLLALAGSLLSVHSPGVGGALILLALLSVIIDGLLGVSPGRRLTFERASENVIGHAPTATNETRLIVTANYDAGRTGLVYRSTLRAWTAKLTQATRGLTPGWLGWIVVSIIWLEAVAIARLDGARGTTIGVVQLIPTVALVLTLALLLDAGSSDFGPAAGDNGSGVAVAIALSRALDAAPPRHLAIELVLTGTSDGIGLARYLRRHKDAIDARSTVVLGVAAASHGTPHWWASDGPLIPLGYFPKLRELCMAIADRDPGLAARPHRGRGSSPAFAARLRRIPAISIGSLDERGIVPGSHQRSDTVEAIDPEALDRAVEFGLLLVDALDAHLATNVRSA